MKAEGNKKDNQNVGTEKNKKPSTLFELFIYLIKNFIKTLPKRLIFALITFLIVMGIHTYLMVYINDGFNIDRKNGILNYLLRLRGYSFGNKAFGDKLRLFNVSLFWALLSLLFWSCVGQIRGLGIKMFFLKIIDGFAKLMTDIFEKPGSRLLSLFIGAASFGFLTGMFLRNPLVAILLSMLLFLSVCARGSSLLILVLYLFWSDLQRLFRVKKRAFYIDIVSMVLRGISVGLLFFSIMPFVKYGGTIQFIVLVAFITLLLLNIFKKTKPSAASFLFLLGNILIVGMFKVFADDGGWSEAGGSFWNWITSEGALEAFKRGLEPALWATSLALGFVPILGDIKDAQEALTGIDLVTGEELSTAERLITGLAMFIPIVNGKALRAGGDLADFAFTHGDEALEAVGRYGDDAAQLGTRYGDDVVDGASDTARGTDSNSGVSEVAGGSTKTLTTAEAEEHAFNAIKGSDKADSVMLGKYEKGSPSSYDEMANDYGSQYFNLDNWDELSDNYSSDEIWKINERFLDIQTSSGREIYLSHNPADYIGDGSFYSLEIQYLIDNGYQFVKEGDVWHAVR